MTLRDSGKLKWAPVAFLPEYPKLLRDLDTDYYRQQKPIIDEFNSYSISISATEWNMILR